MKKILIIALICLNIISCADNGSNTSDMAGSGTKDSGSETIEPEPELDKTPPVAGAIKALSGFSSVRIDWTAASDNESLTEKLKYKLVYSTSNNIDSPELADKNGTAYGSWDTGIYTKNVQTLNDSITYYFALLVKDEAENVSSYTIVSETTKAFECRIYFQNGMGSFYITDIQARHSTSDTWTTLRTGYPYINPTQDPAYSSISPRYTITKSSYWFRYKVVSHDWATKEITDLQAGRIYRVLLYDNTFSNYVLQPVGTY